MLRLCLDYIRRDAAYISSAQSCTNWSMPCGPVFLRARRWACRRKSDDRQARASSFTSLTCLYRRAVSRVRISRQTEIEQTEWKDDPTFRSELPAFNIAQWKNFCFGRRARVLDARANKVNSNFMVYSKTRRYWSFFLPRRHRLIDSRRCRNLATRFFFFFFFLSAAMNNTRMEFQITNGACANVSNRIKEGELPPVLPPPSFD